MSAYHLEQVCGLQAVLRDLRTIPTGKLSKLPVAIQLGHEIDGGKAAFARVNILFSTSPAQDAEEKTCLMIGPFHRMSNWV